MMVITNGRVIGPRTLLEQHCVVIDAGKIKQVTPTAQVMWPEGTEVIDAAGQFVAPGLIDLHVHGALGRDSMEASVEAVAQIAKFHASGGTTAMTLTTMTDTRERITAALEAIEQSMGHDFGGAAILGAHVEGPFISRERCGGQPAQLCRNPDPAEYLPWLDREGLVTEMTLAPELPGALELIDALLEREMLPSGGHTAARSAQVQAAIDRGLCHATHVFNCMSTASKVGAFREPGALETFLAEDGVMVELIADGKHVHPELMKMAVRAKGMDRVCLITDGSAGAGMPEGGEFHIGATAGVVRDGVGMMTDGSALVGSVSTMMGMVRNMVELVGISLVDAVRMGSLNPARALGISGHKGSLEPRRDADIVIFSPTFEVRKTVVGGVVEYSAEPAGALA